MNLDSCRTALSTLSDEAFAKNTKPTSLRLYPTGSNLDESGIAVYYAPLEAVNANARVILVGITPGAS
jgi:hypothetical protein